MAITKKASEKIYDSISKEIHRQNKKKLHAISVKRIDDEMETLSQERGKKYRNVDLARDIGIDASLITKWRKGTEIKDYHLQAMAKLFHVEKSWLDGSGDARLHESYNSVIKRTGLSEEAIEILTNKRKLSEELLPNAGLLDPYGGFLDAVNYLIVDGGNLIEAFARAKRDIEQLRKAKLEHLDPFGIPEEATDIALTSYDIGWNEHGAKYTEALFSEEIGMYKFQMDDSSERRPLTKDEQHHLFEYANAAQLFHPKSARYYCMEQLTLLFSAIESSES